MVFGLLFGIAAALVGEENPERGEQIRSFIDTTQAVVMRLVKIVISLTPYGVLALMTRVIVTTDGSAILNLISFVVASYIAIAIMFVVHTVLIGLFGGQHSQLFPKGLAGADLRLRYSQLGGGLFRSRSARRSKSLMCPRLSLILPRHLVRPIGQNGCAGLYPAMLAVMVAASGGNRDLIRICDFSGVNRGYWLVWHRRRWWRRDERSARGAARTGFPRYYRRTTNLDRTAYRYGAHSA